MAKHTTKRELKEAGANSRARSATRNAPPISDPDLPEGYEELNAGRVAGWFVLAEGNSFQGVLRDTFEVNGKFGKKKVFKVLLTAGETEILTAENGEETVGAGTLIGVDEKGYLKGLSDVAEGTDLFVKCLGKDEPTKEYPRGVWKFKLAVRKSREPGDDGPLPF